MPHPIYAAGRELTFHVASGTSIDDCSVIVNANPIDGFDPHDAVSWLVSRSAGRRGARTHVHGPERGLFTRVWRSSDGATFVAKQPDVVLSWPSDGASPQRSRLPFVVNGVGGTLDGVAFAFGTEVGEGGPRPVVSRYVSARWAPAERVPRAITALAGVDARHVFAVGPNGALMLCDGTSWHVLQLDTTASFAGLSARGPDLAFASSWSGELVELSSKGCARLARAPSWLADVAVLSGDIFAASGPRGELLRFRAGELDPVACPGPPRSIDDRGERLLLTSTDMLQDTNDAVSFRTFEIDELREELRLDRLDGSG